MAGTDVCVMLISEKYSHHLNKCIQMDTFAVTDLVFPIGLSIPMVRVPTYCFGHFPQNLQVIEIMAWGRLR